MCTVWMTLDTRVLAALEGGTPKFQSFDFARRVLELSEYFKDAPKEEVSNFANHAKFADSSAPEFLAAANAAIRKKIALVRQSGILEEFTTGPTIANSIYFKL